MSGIKYLNFIADIFAIPADVRQEKIRKYADLFELTQDPGQPISAYSHGMKQKLAVISAWLHDPKLIVMDEPFVGLDPKASHLLKEMMREHCNKGGAIFFSTRLKIIRTRRSPSILHRMVFPSIRRLGLCRPMRKRR